MFRFFVSALNIRDSTQFNDIITLLWECLCIYMTIEAELLYKGWKRASKNISEVSMFFHQSFIDMYTIMNGC